jgi:uncharacterized iron-regulated protein
MTDPWLLRPFLIVLALLGLPALAWAGPVPPVPTLQGEILADHRLAGRIYRAGTNEELSPERLAAALAAAPFVLLGEKHDNPDHHALQAWAIAALAAAGRRPSIVWEMITLDQAPALGTYLAQPSRNAAGLGPAIGWEKTGWPAWSLYQPIAAAALAGGMTIAVGDLDRATIRAISRQGLDAQPAEFRARLGLDAAYGPDDAASLHRELVESHCGLLPEAALGRMSDVQRSRDAHMARQLIDNGKGKEDGAVLIAGAGHVRRDRAVPWHLARLAPGRGVVTLEFSEVGRDRTDPRRYGIDATTGAAIFDYVWLTPRVDEADPCAKNREQLERLRQRP